MTTRYVHQHPFRDDGSARYRSIHDEQDSQLAARYGVTPDRIAALRDDQGRLRIRGTSRALFDSSLEAWTLGAAELADTDKKLNKFIRGWTAGLALACWLTGDDLADYPRSWAGGSSGGIYSPADLRAVREILDEVEAVYEGSHPLGAPGMFLAVGRALARWELMKGRPHGCRKQFEYIHRLMATARQ